ncbi:MAG: hypothetical protein IKD58_00245 [Loktanella sp.]|nr:hypothetical protein [Loktanella sp.]
MRIFKITAAAIWMGTAVGSQTVEDCVSIFNTDDRLYCYDELFMSDQTQLSYDQDFTSNWVVNTSTSPLDGSQTVTMSLQSQNLVPANSPDNWPTPAELVIRCQERQTNVFIFFNDWQFVAQNQSSGLSWFDYRVDDLPPKKQIIQVSGDNRALAYFSRRYASGFLDGIVEGDLLYVRADPYRAAPVEASFVIHGLSEAIIPLRESCGW